MHRFDIVLSEADLVEAFRLNARFERLRPVIIAFVLVSALLIALLILSPAARYSVNHRPLTLLLEGAVGVLLLLAIALFAFTGRIWRLGARRSFAQRRDLSEPIHYEIDEDTLRHTSCFSNSAYPWSALRAWNESDSLLLIYISDALFYPIPKAKAPAEAIEAIRGALTNAGVAKC